MVTYKVVHHQTSTVKIMGEAWHEREAIISN